MNDGEKSSIFREYYSTHPLVDRFERQPEQAVDVIIPVVHTNELWEKNLLSIYREIPINRLLIGDGGCVDDSIKIAEKFPRVTVFNHRQYTSLGYSIRKLIEVVATPWFIYLHSDVYLPPGWFTTMLKHQSEYDWFECQQRLTVLADYTMDYTNYHRPLSGSQMGRTEAFKNVLPKIDDDYLYRNEDLILAELIQEQGFRYGRADDTFHYHQMMHKESTWKRKIKSVSFNIEKGADEETREWRMQLYGLVKYTKPTPPMVEGVKGAIREMYRLGIMDWSEFHAWAASTNSAWLPFLKPQTNRRWLERTLTAIHRRVFRP